MPMKRCSQSGIDSQERSACQIGAREQWTDPYRLRSSSDRKPQPVPAKQIVEGMNLYLDKINHQMAGRKVDVMIENDGPIPRGR